MAEDSFDDESFGAIPIRQENGVYSVFLVKMKSGDHWGFPKGHREPNESLDEVIRRELQEETGLLIKRYLSNSFFQEVYSFKREGKQVKKRVIYYLVEVIGNGVVCESEELWEGGWFEIHEAERIITFEEGKGVCRDVISFLNERDDSIPLF